MTVLQAGIASKLPEEESQGLLTMTNGLAHIITKEGSGVPRPTHKYAGCFLLSGGLWPASFSTDPAKGDLASPDDKSPAGKGKVGCA